VSAPTAANSFQCGRLAVAGGNAILIEPSKSLNISLLHRTLP